MSLIDNPLIDTDSYKISHHRQYPPGTQGMFDYFESRGGKFDSTVFFGLDAILKRHFSKPITLQDVAEADEFFSEHVGPGIFPTDSFLHVARELSGKLPMVIRAVPEGTVVPTGNVLFTVHSDDRKAYHAVSYFEAALQRVWYPTTVATLSRECKKLILAALRKTSDNPDAEISFKLHDFGSRGVSSQESAGLGGAAHLVNFLGSDTVMGIAYAREYYGEKMAGYSIAAAEHSTITSWGKPHEAEAYRNILTQFAKPGGIVAVVSDSYDLFNAIDNIWGGELRQKVIDSGATVVIRPDSGHPPTIVLECLKRLDAKFGHTINTKGYRVLNNVRVIQGDGINYESIQEIIDTFVEAGYSATNVAFGMGGALLQQVNRDTQKFAIKCSSVVVDGKACPVFKDPVTDPGKRSKAGRVDLFRNETTGILEARQGFSWDSELRTVYAYGTIMENDFNKFSNIRKRAAEGL